MLKGGKPRAFTNLDIPRPALLDRLNAGVQRKLTLLCAPAGFGKTTLLAEWITHHQLPVAWLSLDHDDNAPPMFLRYFVAALHTLYPNLGKTLPLDQDLNAPAIFQSTLTTLINEIADFAMPLILVIDN
jgi:LuxR family maltose regulon positive regulatory protein